MRKLKMRRKSKRKPLEYALFLLKLRDRSTGELVNKMREKEYQDSEIAETVSWLSEKKFLNDERFARNFVKNYSECKPRGHYWFERKLKEKKISGVIIKAVLEELLINDKERIKAAADKWLLRHRNIEKAQIYQKLGSHLIRCGFDFEAIIEQLARITNK